jgi:hypothetical protein
MEEGAEAAVTTPRLREGARAARGRAGARRFRYGDFWKGCGGGDADCERDAGRGAAAAAAEQWGVDAYNSYIISSRDFTRPKHIKSKRFLNCK